MSSFDAGVVPMPAPGEKEIQPLDSGARSILRGTSRYFESLGAASLSEFTLKNGRRADLIALFPDGKVTIVEIKSSVADFRADQKWHHYLEYCDRFCFAVAENFPTEILPSEPGVLIADAFEAVELRPSPWSPMNAARRKALTLRFALSAALRLQREE